MQLGSEYRHSKLWFTVTLNTCIPKLWNSAQSVVNTVLVLSLLRNICVTNLVIIKIFYQYGNNIPSLYHCNVTTFAQIHYTIYTLFYVKSSVCNLNT